MIMQNDLSIACRALARVQIRARDTSKPERIIVVLIVLGIVGQRLADVIDIDDGTRRPVG